MTGCFIWVAQRQWNIYEYSIWVLYHRTPAPTRILPSVLAWGFLPSSTVPSDPDFMKRIKKQIPVF